MEVQAGVRADGVEEREVERHFVSGGRREERVFLRERALHLSGQLLVGDGAQHVPHALLVAAHQEEHRLHQVLSPRQLRRLCAQVAHGLARGGLHQRRGLSERPPRVSAGVHHGLNFRDKRDRFHSQPRFALLGYSYNLAFLLLIHGSFIPL